MQEDDAIYNEVSNDLAQMDITYDLMKQVASNIQAANNIIDLNFDTLDATKFDVEAIAKIVNSISSAQIVLSDSIIANVSPILNKISGLNDFVDNTFNNLPEIDTLETYKLDRDELEKNINSIMDQIELQVGDMMSGVLPQDDYNTDIVHKLTDTLNNYAGDLENINKNIETTVATLTSRQGAIESIIGTNLQSINDIVSKKDAIKEVLQTISDSSIEFNNELHKLEKLKSQTSNKTEQLTYINKITQLKADNSISNTDISKNLNMLIAELTTSMENLPDALSKRKSSKQVSAMVDAGLIPEDIAKDVKKLVSHIISIDKTESTNTLNSTIESNALSQKLTDNVSLQLNKLSVSRKAREEFAQILSDDISDAFSNVLNTVDALPGFKRFRTLIGFGDATFDKAQEAALQGFNDELSNSGNLIKAMNVGFKTALKTVGALTLAIGAMTLGIGLIIAGVIALAKMLVDAVNNIQAASRELDISKASVIELNKELSKSGVILKEGYEILTGINEQLGYNILLYNNIAAVAERFVTPIDLYNDKLGISKEILSQLAIAANSTGSSLDEVVLNASDFVTKFAQTTGQFISINEVLTDIANVSKSIQYQLGGPLSNKLLNATRLSKKFGLSLNDVSGIADSLAGGSLDSVLEKELEFSLLTGLNVDFTDIFVSKALGDEATAIELTLGKIKDLFGGFNGDLTDLNQQQKLQLSAMSNALGLTQDEIFSMFEASRLDDYLSSLGGVDTAFGDLIKSIDKMSSEDILKNYNNIDGEIKARFETELNAQKAAIAASEALYNADKSNADNYSKMIQDKQKLDLIMKSQLKLTTQVNEQFTDSLSKKWAIIKQNVMVSLVSAFDRIMEKYGGLEPALEKFGIWIGDISEKIIAWFQSDGPDKMVSAFNSIVMIGKVLIGIAGALAVGKIFKVLSTLLGGATAASATAVNAATTAARTGSTVANTATVANSVTKTAKAVNAAKSVASMGVPLLASHVGGNMQNNSVEGSKKHTVGQSLEQTGDASLYKQAATWLGGVAKKGVNYISELSPLERAKSFTTSLIEKYAPKIKAAAPKVVSKIPGVGALVESVMISGDIKDMLASGKPETEINDAIGKRVLQGLGGLFGAGLGYAGGAAIGTALTGLLALPTAGAGAALGPLIVPAFGMLGSLAGDFLGRSLTGVLADNVNTAPIGKFMVDTFGFDRPGAISDDESAITDAAPVKQPLNDFVIQDGNIHPINSQDEIIGAKPDGMLEKIIQYGTAQPTTDQSTITTNNTVNDTKQDDTLMNKIIVGLDNMVKELKNISNQKQTILIKMPNGLIRDISEYITSANDLKYSARK